MKFIPYIPFENRQGSAREWLKQEYHRQKIMNLKTGETFKWIPGKTPQEDKMIPNGVWGKKENNS